MNFLKGCCGLMKRWRGGMMGVKKYMVILPISAVTVFVALPEKADAQFVITEVLQQTVGRVIRAIDLEVQRIQNQTIWLQDAQKALENQLSKLKLDEISDWTQKQKDLYGEYYQELWEVKSAIAAYTRIYDVTAKQEALVRLYQRQWGLLKSDKHFTAAELEYMGKVYTGILDESVKNMDQLLQVVVPSKTQMHDAERLKLINASADGVDRNFSDLQQFNNQNVEMSLQRAQDENEVLTLRRYYGIN